MPPKRTKKRGLATADVLKAASDEVLAGGLSVRAVAKDYKMCHVTLHRYCKKRQNLMRVGSSVLPRSSYRSHFRVFNDQQEETLVSCLMQSADLYFGLCPKEVRI